MFPDALNLNSFVASHEVSYDSHSIEEGLSQNAKSDDISAVNSETVKDECSQQENVINNHQSNSEQEQGNFPHSIFIHRVGISRGYNDVICVTKRRH